MSDVYPFDQFDVREKVIVTTGGARGLGFNMAHQLSEAGAEGTVSSSPVIVILLNLPSICFRHSRKTRWGFLTSTSSQIPPWWDLAIYQRRRDRRAKG